MRLAGFGAKGEDAGRSGGVDGRTWRGSLGLLYPDWEHIVRKLIVAAATFALFAGASPSLAAPCRDAHGKFA